MRIRRSKPVFRIRDILVRIRILRSVPLNNGSGSMQIILFSSVTFKMPTKNNLFFSKFLLLFLLKVHLHNSSKIKSHKEVIKQKKSRFFFIFYLLMEGSRSGAGSIQTNCGSGRKNRNTAPKSFHGSLHIQSS
jgi:hypothetical protein